MIWLPLAAAAVNMIQKQRDADQQRKQVGAQMESDYAASLTGGPNSYRAPPEQPKSNDYSALFSMFSTKKPSLADQGSSDSPVSQYAKGTIQDPWADEAKKKQDNPFG